MAKVVNDPENLPIKILVKRLVDFEKFGITEAFLNTTTNEGYKAGVKRNGYWILKTDIITRNPVNDLPFIRFKKLMELSWKWGFQMIQIIK